MKYDKISQIYCSPITHKSDILTKEKYRFFEREIAIMFRLWGKVWKENKVVKDMVVEDPSEDTRTHKIFRGLDEICHSFDLSKHIWLDKTIREFKRHDRVRFTQDNFIESIDFDYLEIHVIEED